jgi:small-conductance mechanosensitive channel
VAGFGAHTLLKDVTSGTFYLLDDAFRVGEYIQSGSYKGTVESFSLRSVKLRHHRGPVYTVPFGQLGAVQNMSRDWAIDKFQIGVTYDIDLDRARKLIKKLGAELAEDPEYTRHIVEPLKMQGEEQSGDYALQVRCKTTTRAVREPAQGAGAHQANLRRQGHPVRLADGAGRGWRGDCPRSSAARDRMAQS